MNTEHINNLKEAVALSPTNIPLRIMLAEALIAKSLGDEAERILQGNLEIDPHNFKSKFLLAQAYFNRGSYGAALLIAEELVNAKEDVDALVLYAKALLKDNELEKAARFYMKAKSIDDSIEVDELEKIVRVSQAETENSSSTEKESELEHSKDKFGLMEKPDMDFSDVGGMKKVKDDIRIKIILPQENKKLFDAYGKKAGGGVLLYGPPGCGKTYLARATAGQIKSKFISVGINDIMNMYIGQSEKNLHELFETARKHKPCVLFFDEVDALGASRSDMKSSAGRHVINQFLSEMDGVSANNEGILVMGATNVPWYLDAAFRRPGRFDKIVFVPPPDDEAKAEIIRLHLRGKPTTDIDVVKIVPYMKDFSGADIKAVVDTAVEEKLREAMEKGEIFPINTNDLIKAARTIKPSTAEWFMTAKNYAVYSNNSGVYDDILAYLKITK